MKLVIHTYENADTQPVISHTFYGRTTAEIQDVIKAHMGTDAFFRASMTSGNFKGIKLRNVQRWTR